VFIMTRHDDINENVKSARRNSGLSNPGKSTTKRGRLYGRYVSGRCDAAPQQRIRGVLHGTLARCALVRMKVQRG